MCGACNVADADRRHFMHERTVLIVCRASPAARAETSQLKSNQQTLGYVDLIVLTDTHHTPPQMHITFAFSPVFFLFSINPCNPRPHFCPLLPQAQNYIRVDMFAILTLKSVLTIMASPIFVKLSNPHNSYPHNGSYPDNKRSNVQLNKEGKAPFLLNVVLLR
nr:hypothetical protein HmN_000364200 [Hymenolepis microstoma]